MYDEIAKSLQSAATCDVHELAARVFAEAERAGDPERQVERLHRDIEEIFKECGRLSDCNARYRALCLQLILQERIIDLYQRGAYTRLHPYSRERQMRHVLHSGVGTLRQIGSTMIGKNFAASGGLLMESSPSLLARAERLVRPVIDAHPSSLLSAAAAVEAAHLALMCGEKCLGPRLTAFEAAADGYERAASLYFAAVGAEDTAFNVRSWSSERLTELWEGFTESRRQVYLRAFSPIISGLSRSYVVTGRAEEARQAALLHRDTDRHMGNETGILTAELELAVADEQLDQVRAIEGLERVLSEEWTAQQLLTGSQVIRHRIVDAMGRLALLLNGQGATAARQQWVAIAQTWLDGEGNSHQRAAKRRVTDADRWQNPETGTGWDAAPIRLGIIAPPTRGGLADPSDDGLSRSLFYICRDLNAYLEAQHVPALVRQLTRLAAMLLDRRRQLSAKARLERASELSQVMRKIDRWRPARRAHHLTEALPEEWLTDPCREALRVAELCWEFADHYCPDAGLPALKVAGRAALQVYDDPGHDQHHRIWKETAKRARRLGNWQLEVNAELKVSWSCSRAKPPRPQEATLAARRAYRAMRSGFERLANLYEVTTLLDKEWAVHPVRIARAFAHADPQSWEAFSALDFGRGLTLAAMRSAESATLREMVALQHEERQFPTAAGQNGAADSRRLLEVRSSILDLAKRGGSLLLAGSGPGELNGLLWELGPNAAVIQLGKTKNDVIVSAARLVDDRIVYHSFELGRHSQLKTLMARMWQIINVDPVAVEGDDLTGPSALDEAYGVLVEPLREFLSGATSWNIVAHDDLAGFPVHAIRTPEGRFLIEEVTIGYAPSIKALLDTMAPPDPTGAALVIGPGDDPAAGNETRQIARIIEEAGAGAATVSETPGRLLDGQSWRVIHIVAHGESRPFPDALKSYLEFDSVSVTAQEVLDRGARAGLVFINACHLANSSPFGGDLFGFPFAFLASGSPVIAAAAPIYRPYASWFAQDLHRALLDSPTPLDAYTRTVRSFIADPWQRHPVFWAPYFYIGG